MRLITEEYQTTWSISASISTHRIGSTIIDRSSWRFHHCLYFGPSGRGQFHGTLDALASRWLFCGLYHYLFVFALPPLGSPLFSRFISPFHAHTLSATFTRRSACPLLLLPTPSFPVSISSNEPPSSERMANDAHSTYSAFDPRLTPSYNSICAYDTRCYALLDFASRLFPPLLPGTTEQKIRWSELNHVVHVASSFLSLYREA